jgi:hypothetical protein
LFKPGLSSGVLEATTGSGCGNYNDYQAVFGDFRVEGNSAFAVNPGDVVFAYAEVENAGEGYVFVEDLTLDIYTNATISVTASLVGQNAEWTVSRGGEGSGGPGHDGETPLANTTYNFFDAGLLFAGSGKQFSPGSQASSTLVLTMMNDSATEPIETVQQMGLPPSSGYRAVGCTGTPLHHNRLRLRRRLHSVAAPLRGRALEPESPSAKAKCTTFVSRVNRRTAIRIVRSSQVPSPS